MSKKAKSKSAPQPIKPGAWRMEAFQKKQEAALAGMLQNQDPRAPKPLAGRPRLGAERRATASFTLPVSYLDRLKIISEHKKMSMSLLAEQAFAAYFLETEK